MSESSRREKAERGPGRRGRGRDSEGLDAGEGDWRLVWNACWGHWLRHGALVVGRRIPRQ